jgi:putative ABC transport system substrate-binding protein
MNLFPSNSLSDKWAGLLVIAFVLGVAGTVAEAQQPRKTYRIGVLRAGSALADKSLTDAFREGLRELGYVEGKNIIFEYRYAEGKRDRWPDIAADMVGSKPDVIVVGGTGLTAVVKQATSTIPIVVGGRW